MLSNAQQRSIHALGHTTAFHVFLRAQRHPQGDTHTTSPQSGEFYWTSSRRKSVVPSAQESQLKLHANERQSSRRSCTALQE